jgi:hypothetical protein
MTKSVRAEIQLKTITIEGDVARAPYFYELNYQIPGPSSTPIWKREADTNMLVLRLEDGVWRITGGV